MLQNDVCSSLCLEYAPTLVFCDTVYDVQCALVRNAWRLLFAADRRRFRAEGHQLGRQHADPTAAVGHRRCVGMLRHVYLHSRHSRTLFRCLNKFQVGF